MRRIALVASIALAACSNDPCSNVDGTCLGVRITKGPTLDNLVFTLSGAINRTGTTQHAAHAPPIETALELPSTASGLLHVDILAERDESVVAHGDADVTLVAGHSQSIDVALSSGTGFSDEGTLGDAATGMSDASEPTDMSANVRYIFLMPPHDGQLGTAAQLDDSCTAMGSAIEPGRVFRALLDFDGDGGDPAARIELDDVLPLVLPSGVLVGKSTKSLFSSPPLVHGIDELADGTKVGAQCVWTAFNFGGDPFLPPPKNQTCASWSSNSGDLSGYYGATSWDMYVSYTFDGVNSCDQHCYVYCVEQ